MDSGNQTKPSSSNLSLGQAFWRTLWFVQWATPERARPYVDMTQVHERKIDSCLSSEERGYILGWTFNGLCLGLAVGALMSGIAYAVGVSLAGLILLPVVVVPGLAGAFLAWWIKDSQMGWGELNLNREKMIYSPLIFPEPMTASKR